MNITNMLEELIQPDGISGCEDDISQYLSKRLGQYCKEVMVQKCGNVVGLLDDYNQNKKTILLEAHMDRIGLCVTKIEDGGFVRFKALGGVDERILPASEVVIRGSESIYGVIGAVPPHLADSGKKDSCLKLSDMVIDTGYTKEELQSKISVGDPILLKYEFCELLDGRVSSAALDNRAGIASIFACIDMLKGKELPVNVKIAFSVGEELGLNGARTLIDDVPDLAVVIDVTHGKTLDNDELGIFSLGSGVDICRGPNLHYEITNKVIDLAKEYNIPYQVEVASASTGTNAWVIQISREGVPCVLLSIPLRYMHTTVETLDTEDINSVSRLLEKIVLGGEGIA